MLQPAPRSQPRLHVVDAPAAVAQPLPISTRAFWLLAGGAVLMGLLVRASFVLGSDFPLNDGGMFFQMARDLQANGYALPATTTYNGADLPFAYPPLGFYVAAFIDDATPLSLLDAFRLLPLIADTALLGVFLLLARRFLTTRAEVLIALTIFALLPPSFLWMLMGGGVTRAPGFVFALLTIWQAHAMFAQPARWRPVAVGVLAALAILTHLEMAWYAAFSSGLLFAAYGRSRRAVIDVATVGVLAVTLSAPWWASVIATHGTEPFLAAAQTGGGSPIVVVADLLQFRVTAEPLFVVFGALGLLGILTCISRRQYVLPVWVVACAILDPRAFPTSASVPVAMLAATASYHVLLPLVRPTTPETNTAPRWLLPGLIIGLTLYGFLGAMISSPERLTGMAESERAAMGWARENTAETDGFAIVSGDAWPVDRTSEWFPAIAERRSVGTVQGFEWIRGAFRPRIDAYMALQDCADDGVTCLDAWASEQESFEYVYVPKLDPRVTIKIDEECCVPLIRDQRDDEGYALVFDNDGALIFERR